MHKMENRNDNRERQENREERAQKNEEIKATGSMSLVDEKRKHKIELLTIIGERLIITS